MRLFLFLFLLFCLTGCSLDESSSSENEVELSDTWTFNSSTNTYKTLGSNVTELTLTGDDIAGKTLYAVKVNNGSSTISASNTSYVTNASSGITLYTAGNSSSSFPDNPNFSNTCISANLSLSSSDLELYSTSRSASIITEDVEVEQITPEVGTTKKSIYIDTDSNISTFRGATATLRAIGKYCYVWTIDGYYEDDTAGTYSYDDEEGSYTTYSDEQVSSSVVQAFADKFDEIYPMIRHVFGYESNKMYYKYSNGSFTTADMSYLSDTGTMVNIVLYDIGADFSNNNSTGIVGYFYAKDYYPNKNHISTLSGGSSYANSSALNYSNEGKYFYIDAYYTSDYTDMTYSTLGHEFQHMIQYGVKTMDQGLSAGTAYNEMMSMLCEDMMQNYLGISDDDSPVNRLAMFNKCYRYSGLEYRNSSTNYTLMSYASNYAFGSWLVRNFGGTKLIKEISQNNSIDITSIVNGVNTLNDISYSISDLLARYAQGCVLENASYTHNKTADTTLSYSNYEYPLTAIDLWNLDQRLTTSNSNYYKYDGPEVYGYNAQYDIRPYGMTIINIGTISDDANSVTINFSRSSSSNESVYLFMSGATAFTTTD